LGGHPRRLPPASGAAIVTGREKTPRFCAASRHGSGTCWLRLDRSETARISKFQAGPFEGQVTALLTDAHSVDTENKTSEGTVYFSAEVRPASDFQKLSKGDRIAGRMVVDSNNVYINDVQIAK
jgi:hypothetical protein